MTITWKITVLLNILTSKIFFWKPSINMHLSKKIYILRFNDNPFMTKALRKALMHRSKLKNVFHKTRAKEDWNNCKRTKKPVADAGGCHCCQCSTPKWLTLIFRVEFSELRFLKMLRTRFWNLTKSNYGRHWSETSVNGCSFSCCLLFSTIRDSVQC